MSGFADSRARNAERRMVPFISIDKDGLANSRARSALFVSRSESRNLSVGKDWIPETAPKKTDYLSRCIWAGPALALEG